MNKVLIIGLDGVPWSILNKMIDEVAMENFSEVIKRGSTANMKSVIPPVSEPAWLSIATGLNPGKTGVIDFLNRKSEDTYKLVPTSSSDFKGKAIWDIANIFGKKTGIVNYPLLYPPYRVNGFMISGMGSTNIADITYPKELINEINKIVGKYEIEIGYHFKKYNNMDRFFNDLFRIFEKRRQIFLYLLKNKAWDLFFIVFSCTDWLLHITWHLIDDKHPYFSKSEKEKYYDKIQRFFKEIDEMIGDVMNIIDERANMIILSDHGFGPQFGVFNLYQWLKSNNYIVEKKSLLIKLKKTQQFILDLLYKSLLGVSLPIELDNYMDFDESMAYTLNHTIPFGDIYINNKKTFDSSDIKEKIKADIIKWGLEHDIEITVHDVKRIYRGEKINTLPDLILEIDNFAGVVIRKPFLNQIYKKSSYSKRHTGSHRLNGIFIAYGEDINEGRSFNSIKIFDIAPTILHMLGTPLPDDLDGKPLTNIFKENSQLRKRSPKYISRKKIKFLHRFKNKLVPK